MNLFIKNISSGMMIFALVVSAFNLPMAHLAYAQQTESGFSFDIPGFDLPDFDLPDFSFARCEITASNTEIFSGGSVTLYWETEGFDTITINGEEFTSDSGSVVKGNIVTNTTFTLVARTADSSSTCTASVQIICIPPPVDCRLSVSKVVDKATAQAGDTLTYTVVVKNIGTTDCTGSGVKIEDVVSDKLTYLTHTTSGNVSAGYEGTPVYTAPDRTLHFNGNVLTPGEEGTITFTARVNTPSTCGDFEVPNQAKATAKELNNFNTWITSQTVKTAINNDCPDNPPPVCDSFTATPGTIVVGASTLLSWQTSNASRVVIDNGLGERPVDGSVSVSPLQNTTYRLTAFGTDSRTVTCDVPVIVSDDPVPVCEFFTATPNNLSAQGGQVTLAWRVNGATAVSIAPAVGTVAQNGTQVIPVSASTNFVLTATDADGDQVTCAAPVTVADSPVLSCQNNVAFSASRTAIDEGDETTLTWSTTNIDSLTISVINATTLSGSQTVSPNSDTTYVLTARKGSTSVDCPLTINVDEDGGGGGGGSSSPRCELTISDNKIKRGEEVTLRWNTSRATEVTIKDDRNKVLLDTDKYSSEKKKDYYDGSLKVKPTRDTKYTLTAKRSSRDRTCTVNVDVDDLTILTNRDQQPLVAGISLTDVPYTGFAAGPFLTIVFYTLLVAWALFVSYLIVIRRQPVIGATGGGEHHIGKNEVVMRQAEDIRPDLFPTSVKTAVAGLAVAVPTNLPIASGVVGYGLHNEVFNPVNPHHVTDDVVTTLENRAHAQMALLSSDAIRHFIATTEGTLERNEALDAVIARAKGTYPLEDGWIVINETRMQQLCEECLVTTIATEPFVPVMVPEGSSSLAEAIVTGNVVAAYEMIGNRPMFALADAATDLDAVVRLRRGEDVHISDLLKAKTVALSDEKLRKMITALTGALDGTYTDEASAVKMAIMKSVKEVL